MAKKTTIIATEFPAGVKTSDLLDQVMADIIHLDPGTASKGATLVFKQPDYLKPFDGISNPLSLVIYFGKPDVPPEGNYVTVSGLLHSDRHDGERHTQVVVYKTGSKELSPQHLTRHYQPADVMASKAHLASNLGYRAIDCLPNDLVQFLFNNFWPK